MPLRVGHVLPKAWLRPAAAAKFKVDACAKRGRNVGRIQSLIGADSDFSLFDAAFLRGAKVPRWTDRWTAARRERERIPIRSKSSVALMSLAHRPHASHASQASLNLSRSSAARVLHR